MFKTSLNEQNPIDKVLERLQGVRRSGKGWVARCPAHEDRTPSLSVAEGHDGRVLIKCFAGCTLEAILGALGLEVRDLFPHDDDPWRWTRAPKLPSPRPKPAPRPDEERRRRLERLWAQAVP
ncbi:MAG: CHC2 zinc finger domain-containing protein, partial [Brevundimonas sp.]